MREMLCAHLAESGVDSRTAAGVEEALLMLASGPFFAVVSHLSMRPLDGFALLDGNRGGPPVILMSSFASPPIEREALARGASALISKPFSPSVLIRLLLQLSP